MVEMELNKIIIDEKRQEQIIVLKEKQGERMLPIVIGFVEATSIKMSLSGLVPPRPLTHDLVKNIVDGLGIRITRIVITEIIDNTYYALIHLSDGIKETLIDSRPSDAVAVALRSQVPIYVEEGVMGARTADELDEWLKNLKPEDFGNIM